MFQKKENKQTKNKAEVTWFTALVVFNWPQAQVLFFHEDCLLQKLNLNYLLWLNLYIIWVPWLQTILRRSESTRKSFFFSSRITQTYKKIFNVFFKIIFIWKRYDKYYWMILFVFNLLTNILFIDSIHITTGIFLIEKRQISCRSHQPAPLL